MQQEQKNARFVSESALIALGLPTPENGDSTRAWSGEAQIEGRARVFQLVARRVQGRLEAHVTSFDAKDPSERKDEADLLWEEGSEGAENSAFRVDGRPASQEEALARIAACAAFARNVRDRKAV